MSEQSPDLKKPRKAPPARTPAQKEAARQRYLAKKSEHIEAALNRSNLERFVKDFLVELLNSYAHCVKNGRATPTKDKVVNFRKYDGNIYLEVTATYIRQKYGRKSLEAFKKLFMQFQVGGGVVKETRFTAEPVRIKSLWIRNHEAIEKFNERRTEVFESTGEVTSADIWLMLEDQVSYKRATLEYNRVKIKDGARKGYYTMEAVPGTKKFRPREEFVAVKQERAKLKAHIAELNAGLAEAAAVNRSINLDLPMKLRSIMKRVEQLKVQA